MSILKIMSDTNCSVRCDFQEVGNIQVGELFKLQLKKGCYILEFLVEDVVICAMDYTIETNDEEPLLRLNIKEQAEKKIREQKYIRNKSAKMNIDVDNNHFILDNEANNPVALPKEYVLYYHSADGKYTEDEAGLIPFYTTVKEEKIKNGETYQIEKTLYGSLNKLGKVVIKPIYTTPVVFYNDVITKTTRDKKRYYLNHYGEEIGLSYLNTDAYTINKPLDKNCDLFIAQSTEDELLWGVVRYDKKIIVSISNKTIYENTDNFIWALKGDTLSIYDNEGKWIKSIRYVDLGEIDLPYRRKHQDYVFVHKEAVAVRVSGYWGLYDFDGDVKKPHIYKLLDAYWVYSDFDYESGKEFLTGDGYGSSPLMFVKKKNGGYGIININVFDVSNGILDINNIKEVIPCKYNAIFSNDGKRIELLKENFFQWEEQCDDGSSVEHGIGDNIFFVKHQENLLECDYFYIEMLSFGKKDKEEHFVCKEFNHYQYIDEDGNPHLRGKNRDKSSIDKEELINTSRHALIYSEDGRTIINCDKSFEGELVVPKGVEHIAESAFNSCKAISIHISDSVTSIGCNAFRNSRSLTSITIPNSVTSIGNDVFERCESLTSIIIPKGTRKKFEKMLPEQKDKLVEQGQMTIKETKDRLLFFDTETTGVPLNYKASSSDTKNWPRLVQLAWVLTDEEGNRIHTGNLIVKPEGFIIPTDATRVHGITTQRANEEGVPLAEVIEQFKADLDVATYIVGHNIEFDKKIMGAEMIRLGMKDIMDSKKSYCTMQSSIDFCKIPGKYGYKYPKLQELYKKLFGTEFENAHNAMSDIEATEKCFWELRKRKLI